jgi:hypothetical protein
MAPDNLNRFLDNFDPERRSFLRKIIAGVAFAPPLIASFSLEGPSITPAEGTPVPPPLCSNQTTPVEFFDFSGTEYQDNFSGILRPTDITPGKDLFANTYSSLNFKGSGGSTNSTKSTWLTVFDATTPLPEDACQLMLSADILITTFNNSKGAGLLALFNEAAGKKGLAVLLLNAGNSDVLQLVTVDQTSKLAVLKSVSLGGGIQENVWYRVTMDITDTSEPSVTVTGTVTRHSVATNPNSPLLPPPIGTLVFTGPLPSGVDSTGKVGLVARAANAVVDLSITNYTITESPHS